jgi:glutamate-5-semialdehyde dehydrogenase
MTADPASYATTLARQARAAASDLATAPTARKNAWLHRAAGLLTERQDTILAANAEDLAGNPELTGALRDRLTLTPARLASAAEGLRQVAELSDPIGEIRESRRRPNGLEVFKVGVPLGVIFFIYESRPNVTLDAAALSVKAGNAILLRGGREARHSNLALVQLLQHALAETGLPGQAVQLVENLDRTVIGHLLQLNELIDLAIPRGGEGLIRAVASQATMPVLKHYQGNCHVYIHEEADPAMAEAILVNAKTQRPGVCNAAESLLIDAAIAANLLPTLATALRARGVELRGCARTREILPDANVATEEDYAAEYLDLILSIKVVSGLEEAIAHINRYGSHHSDAIVTRDYFAARRFTTAVDSAAVLVNASTRFNDGFELGLGAEIGISTDKFHARGPCGLLELTSYKYVILGDGQTRS